MLRKNTFSLTIYPWIVVCAGMLFYCYNYFLRVSPSVMQPELTQTFHITATQFSTLAGFYYWGYTPMQLPAGMIYDKFGVRFVLCLACLVAVMGLCVFINANNYGFAGFGRLLIGFGCSFAYIGTLKLASIWLPSNRFATVAGVTTAAGMLSGAMAQKYLTKAIDIFGYQKSLQTALMAGVILSIVVALLIRNRPVSHNHSIAEMRGPMNIRQLLAALKLIFANRQMWLIGIIGCLLYLPSSVFLDLWGIPYLTSVYHFSAKEAVLISSYTFYGWIIAGPILGVFSDKIKRRRLPLISTGIFAAILLAVVFYVPGIPKSSLYLIFFMVGFCCGGHSICFAFGKENNPVQISGTAIAVTNMMIMAGGAIFQPVVGRLLDMHASGFLDSNGLPIYQPSDYTFALSIIPIGVSIAIFLSFFLKETYCKSQAIDDDKLFSPAHLKPTMNRISDSYIR